MSYNPMLTFDRRKNGMFMKEQFLRLSEDILREARFDKTAMAYVLMGAASAFADDPKEWRNFLAFLERARDLAEAERVKLVAATEQRNG